MFKQILPMCTIRNIWRTVRSLFILILGLKVLSCHENVVYMKDLPCSREIVLVDSFGEILERLRMTLTANVRYDHVTMFILYLPLPVYFK